MERKEAIIKLKKLIGKELHTLTEKHKESKATSLVGVVAYLFFLIFRKHPRRRFQIHHSEKLF